MWVHPFLRFFSPRPHVLFAEPLPRMSPAPSSPTAPGVHDYVMSNEVVSAALAMVTHRGPQCGWGMSAGGGWVGEFWGGGGWVD